MRRKYWLAIGASILLGLIFFTFGLGKIPYQTQFLVFIFHKSFLTPLLAHQIAHWLPWIEVVLGSLLIIGIATKLMASFSALLIVAFIANNSWLIYRGLGDEPCGCPGEIANLGRMSVIDSLYLDMGMVVLVLIILFCYPGSFLTTRPWFFRKR